jgi:hypothetical protein
LLHGHAAHLGHNMAKNLVEPFLEVKDTIECW